MKKYLLPVPTNLQQVESKSSIIIFGDSILHGIRSHEFNYSLQKGFTQKNLCTMQN